MRARVCACACVRARLCVCDIQRRLLAHGLATHAHDDARGAKHQTKYQTRQTLGSQCRRQCRECKRAHGEGGVRMERGHRPARSILLCFIGIE